MRKVRRFQYATPIAVAIVFACSPVVPAESQSVPAVTQGPLFRFGDVVAKSPKEVTALLGTPKIEPQGTDGLSQKQPDEYSYRDGQVRITYRNQRADTVVFNTARTEGSRLVAKLEIGMSRSRIDQLLGAPTHDGKYREGNKEISLVFDQTGRLERIAERDLTHDERDTRPFTREAISAAFGIDNLPAPTVALPAVIRWEDFVLWKREIEVFAVFPDGHGTIDYALMYLKH